MMSYLKFLFVFLLELLKNNPIKILYITVAIITFNFAGSFENDVNEYEVATVVKIDNNYVYVCRSISENKIKYENVWDSKEIPIKNGKIYIESYAFLNGLMWFFFVISCILFIVPTFMSDDDVNWEIEDCWKEAFCTLIYCEEENGEFYYFALGRLIDKRNRQVSRSYSITRELNINGFRDLYRCPKYQTKTQRRETLLSKIGIN